MEVENQTPAYVHRILDAYLDNKTLDFKGEDVPEDVQDRLIDAMCDGRLTTLGSMRRGGRNG